MTQRLSDILKEAIRKAAMSVDDDDAGYLDKAGVRKVLQLIGQNPTKADMNIFFDGIKEHIEIEDIGDFVEQHVPLKSQETINEEIAEAFSKFDKQADYLISKVEFREILTKLGEEPLAETEADAVIKSLGTSSNRVNVSDLSKLLSA